MFHIHIYFFHIKMLNQLCFKPKGSTVSMLATMTRNVNCVEIPDAGISTGLQSAVPVWVVPLA